MPRKLSTHKKAHQPEINRILFFAQEKTMIVAAIKMIVNYQFDSPGSNAFGCGIKKEKPPFLAKGA